jgi:endonuclease/exonuclease/phosphatase family metal-dependent hydrolase
MTMKMFSLNIKGLAGTTQVIRDVLSSPQVNFPDIVCLTEPGTTAYALMKSGAGTNYHGDSNGVVTTTTNVGQFVGSPYLYCIENGNNIAMLSKYAIVSGSIHFLKRSSGINAKASMVCRVTGFGASTDLFVVCVHLDDQNYMKSNTWAHSGALSYTSEERTANGSRTQGPTRHLQIAGQHYINSAFTGWSDNSTSTTDPTWLTIPNQYTGFVTPAERTHDATNSSIFKMIEDYNTTSLPMVMIGDFNAPSHLDWNGFNGTSVPTSGHTTGSASNDGYAWWPISRDLANYGFKDAAKSVVYKIGTEPTNWGTTDHSLSTWPTGSTSSTDNYTPVGYKHERLDQIYYKGTNITSNISDYATYDSLIYDASGSLGINNGTNGTTTATQTGAHKYSGHSDTNITEVTKLVGSYQLPLLAWPADHRGISAIVTIT